MRAGWRNGRSAETASSVTGAPESLRLRPRRRFGWEITSPTSCPEAMRPRRMVAAKAGVPANASFMGVEGGSALAARQQAFAHVAHRVLSGLAVGAVQHKDAVEVVYLVL